ncbi:MAG TPA: ABC transporter substrate-binding protein [Acidimicrobiales bacterium]
MGRSSRARRAMAVLLAAVLAAGACSRSDDDADGGNSGGGNGGNGGGESSGDAGDGVLNVAVVVDRSGPAAFAGLGDQAGIELAQDELEESGFLADEDIELEIEFYDAETNPDRAIEHVNRIVADDDVDVLIGPLNANQALATAPVAQGAGLPNVLMHADAAHPKDIGDLIFRITPPQPSFIGASVDNFAERGIESVGLLYDETNPTLVEIAEEVLPDLFDEAGIEVVYDSTFRPTDTDFSGAAAEIARLAPDGLAMLAVGAVNVTMLNQLREQGFEGAIFSQNASGVFLEAGPVADGIVWSTPFNPASDLETPQKFTAAFEEANGKAPNHFNATGYDALWFVARAAVEGGTSREGVAAGLQAVADEGFEGAQGALTFTDRDARVEPTVMQINGGVEAPYEAP